VIKGKNVEDHTILANSENFGNVTVCPGGVIHVNLPHCSLKFTPSDFVKFTELMGKARLNFDSSSRTSAKPRLHLVSSDPEPPASPEKPE
jgi:hypothetical protein